MRPILKLPTNPLRTISRGDTWYGVAFRILNGAVAVDLTGCTVKSYFRNPAHSVLLETGDGITLTDPTDGQLAIDKIQELDVPAGVYKADLEITFPTGDIVTYVDIHLTVTDDITK